MSDRHAVEELVSRYGAMADERAFDDAASILADEVVAEYPFGRHDGLTAVADAGRDGLGAFAATQHVIANLLVEVDGDQAEVRANLIAVHVHDANVPEAHFDLGGVYRFAARRTPQGWRLTRIHLTAVWTAGVPAPGWSAA